MKLKTMILFMFLALEAVMATAQTNIYYGKMVIDPKSINNCGATGFRYDAHGVYKPPGLGTNSWYFPTATNMSLTFSNSQVFIFANNEFGFQACGQGTVSWTDPNWQNAIDGYRFTLFWPTNIAKPDTNSLYPLTAVNFKTNTP